MVQSQASYCDHPGCGACRLQLADSHATCPAHAGQRLTMSLCIAKQSQSFQVCPCRSATAGLLDAAQADLTCPQAPADVQQLCLTAAHMLHMKDSRHRCPCASLDKLRASGCVPADQPLRDPWTQSRPL